MVPLLTRSRRCRSNWVDTLNAFCCPGVGARKPVLRLPRKAKPSARAKRAASLPFRVAPKSSKSSKRSGPADIPASLSRIEQLRVPI